jgi:hypothetical protein
MDKPFEFANELTAIMSKTPAEPHCTGCYGRIYTTDGSKR